MKRFRCSLIAALGIAFLLGGCTTESRSGNVYSRDQARTGHSVIYGTILRVEPVTIEGTQTGAGTLAGGAIALPQFIPARALGAPVRSRRHAGRYGAGTGPCVEHAARTAWAAAASYFDHTPLCLAWVARSA